MTSRPRLCIMVTSHITATTFLRGYLGFLREDGWDVTLVCSDGPGVAALAEAEGADFQPLAMKREPSPLSDLRAAIGAYRILRRLRPDTLVYATPKASLLGAMAGWAARVPRRVYELWGLRLETSTGSARLVFSALESLTMRLSTVVIANSRSLADRAAELRVDGGKRIRVLGAGSSHGVDADHFSRGAEHPPLDDALRKDLAANAAPVVGFVGRLHPDKGIDILFDSLEICATKGTPLQLLIVGEDEGAELASRVEQLRGLAPVHMAGYSSDPRALLKAMDVLALPSKREGFPNVVLEAAAMELPSVVSDATGCVDSVVDNVTGFVIPVGDAEALAEALMAVLSDEARKGSLGATARARVVEEFAPRDVWERHSKEWRA